MTFNLINFQPIQREWCWHRRCQTSPTGRTYRQPNHDPRRAAEEHPAEDEATHHRRCRGPIIRVGRHTANTRQWDAQSATGDQHGPWLTRASGHATRVWHLDMRRVFGTWTRDACIDACFPDACLDTCAWTTRARRTRVHSIAIGPSSTNQGSCCRMIGSRWPMEILCTFIDRQW